MSNTIINHIVICGANASGKTRLAVSLANKIGGEIVSADSRQVYRGMDIGTGKDLSEYNTPSGIIPYHLIDIVDPSEIYTLYHYQQDCYSIIRDIWSRKIIPVIVGGTGLYIEAVLKKYRIPNVPENPKLRNYLMKQGKDELIEQLRKSDVDLYNSTDMSSTKRIVRSLEIVEYAKRNKVQWGMKQTPDIKPLIIGVRWRRSVLSDRINTRLIQRLENGMTEEVEKLLNSGILLERFAYFGLEYKHVARYLRKEVSYSNMVEELSRDIQRFAKRQVTYFRGMERRGLSIHWVDGADVEKVFKIISGYRFNRNT